MALKIINLISDDEVKDIAPVSANVTITSPLRQHINQAQEYYIRPILCDELYDDLILKVKDNAENGTPIPTDYVTLIDRIQPCLAWYTYWMLLSHYGKVREAGTITWSGQNFSTIDTKTNEMLRNSAHNQAEESAIYLKKFLDKNRTTYPLYCNCSCEDEKIGIRSFLRYR